MSIKYENFIMDLREIINKLEDLEKRVDSAVSILNIDKKKIRINELHFIMNESDFWGNQENATIISKELSNLEDQINFWDKIKKDIFNLKEIANDDVVARDVNLLNEIENSYNDIIKKFEKEEFFLLFDGKYDSSNVILSIHAGAGGDDAQDFAMMLLRMYTRFCNNKNFDISIINETRGGEVGIKSIILNIKGYYAYGYLKSEYGVHRIVRISPFDADHARHTSFALVEVLPELDDVSDVQISEDDIRIDTFMSGGHGGQSVNTTYSAVRIVHIPTNITVSCQNERSQTQNKETAMKVLKSKLLDLKRKEMLDEKNQLKGDYKSIEWGSQIRSYVLNPYRMVKDHRTDFETSDVESVLDGNIEEFIEAFLKKKE